MSIRNSIALIHLAQVSGADLARVFDVAVEVVDGRGAFRADQFEVNHCLSLCFTALPPSFTAFHCPSTVHPLSFHCLSLSIHRPFTAFHCPSTVHLLSFHCLSLSIHRPFTAFHCPSTVLPSSSAVFRRLSPRFCCTQLLGNMRAHSLHTGPELLRQTAGSEISLAGETTIKEMTKPCLTHLTCYLFGWALRSAWL